MGLLKDFKRWAPLAFVLVIFGCNPPNVHVALSSDGKMLAAVHKGGLWAGSIGYERLLDPRKANNPTWSPDDAFLAFEVPTSFPKLVEEERSLGIDFEGPRVNVTSQHTEPDMGGAVVSISGGPERPLPDMNAPFAWPLNDHVMGVLEAPFSDRQSFYWIRTYDVTARKVLSDVGVDKRPIELVPIGGEDFALTDDGGHVEIRKDGRTHVLPTAGGCFALTWNPKVRRLRWLEVTTNRLDRAALCEADVDSLSVVKHPLPAAERLVNVPPGLEAIYVPGPVESSYLPRSGTRLGLLISVHAQNDKKHLALGNENDKRKGSISALYALIYDIGNGKESIVRSISGMQQRGAPYLESMDWSPSTGKLILTYNDRTELVDVPGLTGS